MRPGMKVTITVSTVVEGKKPRKHYSSTAIRPNSSGLKDDKLCNDTANPCERKYNTNVIKPDIPI